MALGTFILKIVGISLLAVMAPGPITAATLAAGTRNRHAGAWVCLGHIAVELPLVLVAALGVTTFLKSPTVQTVTGLAGGLLLIFFGVQLLLSLRKANVDADPAVDRHPLWIGVVLSAANPYFIFWWSTTMLALTGQAAAFGFLALGLFALIHWLCDLGWLELLSYAGFKGSQAFGQKGLARISLVCAVLFLGFGVKFLYDAAANVRL